MTDMLIRKKIPATFILIIAALIVVSGQINSSYSIGRNDIRIKGTSNLHNWEMVVEKVNGNMNANIKNDRIVDINSLTLIVDVNSITSGKSIMDNKTYKALNSEQYPLIKFTLSGISDIKPVSKVQIITARGILSVAGVKKNIAVKATGSLSNDGSMSFTGSKTLNMTDFKVEPPTAIFGTLKTGDKVNIEFDVSFKKYVVITRNE
jgi:polyisoprenoid-binding protein YceI